MSTRIALDEMAKMMPNSIGHYFTDDAIETPAARPGLFARIARAVRSIAEAPYRRRVMNELYSLSAHELADIGLTRAEVPLVFDADFAASRIGANGSHPLVREARRHIRAV
jgi:uncharacterized protein YjiS (DUF1127 family)